MGTPTKVDLSTAIETLIKTIDDNKTSESEIKTSESVEKVLNNDDGRPLCSLSTVSITVSTPILSRIQAG